MDFAFVCPVLYLTNFAAPSGRSLVLVNCPRYWIAKGADTPSGVVPGAKSNRFGNSWEQRWPVRVSDPGFNWIGERFGPERRRSREPEKRSRPSSGCSSSSTVFYALL